MRGQRNVLVVEDNRDLRDAIKGLLEDRGLSVFEAPDGRTAREVLAKGTLDLICLDLVLPESSGYELCEAIRASAQHRDVPVVVISGRTQAADRAFAIEAGADEFVAKPFDASEFLARVDALLSKRSEPVPEAR